MWAFFYLDYIRILTGTIVWLLNVVNDSVIAEMQNVEFHIYIYYGNFRVLFGSFGGNWIEEQCYYMTSLWLNQVMG